MNNGPRGPLLIYWARDFRYNVCYYTHVTNFLPILYFYNYVVSQWTRGELNLRLLRLDAQSTHLKMARRTTPTANI